MNKEFLFAEDIEEWADIPGYEGLYQASTLGRIKSLPRMRITVSGGLCPVQEIIKSTVIGDAGYELVMLSKNGHNRNLLVHRLIAKAHVPNPANKPIVNHKKGNKLDNRSKMLEWSTQSENVIHAHATGLCRKGDHSKREKPVLMLSRDLEPIKIFKSVNEARRRTGISNGTISLCALGKQPTAGGFKWQFINKDQHD